MKHVTLVKLTDEGRKHLREARELWTKVNDVVGNSDGKIEAIWATTGRFDFIVVAEYATGEGALKAHTKLLETELFALESSEAFSMDRFLETV